jgi:hypothetical protein
MPTTTPQSTALSQAGRRLLEIAADRPGHSLLPFPPEVPVRGAVRQRLLARLLRAGLVEEAAAAEPSSTWRTDETGGGITLRLTAPGLAAIGRAPTTTRREARVRRPIAPSPNARDGVDAGLPTGPEPASSVAGGSDAPSGTETPARRHPGGKLGRVLAALRADAGATLSELVTLTGWQPHTTRAALTRLRQRGYALERAEGNGRVAYRIGGAR